ncbi:MAG: hypothetical protein OXU27_18530 [Candidatus Poribacteria bacterium]|nr:hypothetical protein [Candidatus Poribacteria bacterium]
MNMDSSTDTNRPLAHYWHHCILCVFLILLGIFGCGGDEMDISGDEGDEVDTSGDEVNPLAIFFGTWTLLTADDKTHKADLQQIVGNKRTEVLAAESTVDLASDGSMVQIISFTIQLLIDESPGPVYVKARVRSTVKGYYVVSIPNSTITCTPIDDNLNIKATYSVEAPKNPELQRQWEEILALLEYEKEIEADFKEGPVSVELYRKIHTFNLEEDLLTLTSDRAFVYKKR